MDLGIGITSVVLHFKRRGVIKSGHNCSSLTGSSLGSLPCFELSVEQLLRESLVRHPCNVTTPSQLTMADVGFNRDSFASLKYFKI